MFKIWREYCPANDMYICICIELFIIANSSLIFSFRNIHISKSFSVTRQHSNYILMNKHLSFTTHNHRENLSSFFSFIISELSSRFGQRNLKQFSCSRFLTLQAITLWRLNKAQRVWKSNRFHVLAGQRNVIINREESKSRAEVIYLIQDLDGQFN